MLNCNCDNSRWMYRLLSSSPGTTMAGTTGAASTTGSGAGSGSTGSGVSMTCSITGCASFTAVSVSPSLFISRSWRALLPFHQLSCADCEIRQDAISTCSLESGEGFENHSLTQPAILDRGHVHRVFAADLVDKCQYLEFILDPEKDVQIGHAGLDHDHIGAFRQVGRHFVQRFVTVGRVHLVGGLVRLAQVQRRTYRIAER